MKTPRNPAVRRWSAMTILLVLGIGVLATAAVTETAWVALVGAVLVFGSLVAGTFFGEKAAAEIQRDPMFGRRRRPSR